MYMYAYIPMHNFWTKNWHCKVVFWNDAMALNAFWKRALYVFWYYLECFGNYFEDFSPLISMSFSEHHSYTSSTLIIYNNKKYTCSRVGVYIDKFTTHPHIHIHTYIYVYIYIYIYTFLFNSDMNNLQNINMDSDMIWNVFCYFFKIFSLLVSK